MAYEEIDHVATITISASGQISVNPDPIHTIPDKRIIFVIINNHNVDHKVSVSPDDFHREKDSDPGGPEHPIRFTFKHEDGAHAGDAGVFELHVKDSDDFGGNRKGKHFLYKYTIKASDLEPYDPEIDINN